MNTQQIYDEDMPMSKAAFREFCSLVCEGLDPVKTGAIVQPHEVMSLHSDCIAEDGRRIRLYDLWSGRTGCQADDGKITIAD
jgi:hypothetical protein